MKKKNAEKEPNSFSLKNSLVTKSCIVNHTNKMIIEGGKQKWLIKTYQKVKEHFIIIKKGGEDRGLQVWCLIISCQE